LGRITSVEHVGLTVQDLDRSIKFYTEVLECTVSYEQEKQGGYLAEIVGYPGAHVRSVHLRPPGATDRFEIELFEYREPRSVPRELEPCNVGNAHICFGVDDLASVYQRLLEHGVEVFSPPVALDTGVNKGGAALYAKDPDGITLELWQRA
jgi:catechol 2,3-dioxygenase-like lactoylglutathione lyase family enzyme